MDLISKKTQFSGFDIFYDSQESLDQQIDEIFNLKVYDFKAKVDMPIIIDAGSNIGISTLFFKSKYPQAKIICFEPDPRAFYLLSKNIQSNGLKDILLNCSALSKQEGETDFFGQVNVENPDQRGNSIFPEWGLQRKVANKVKVKSTRLSHYLIQPIDFLKLDIEGAEQQVLEEIGEKVTFIKEMAIQVHLIEKLRLVNSLEKITSLLSKNNFQYQAKLQNDANIWPIAVEEWSKKEKPILYFLHGTKIF